ncbi:hypothetical protein L484_017737 [Morus notabilis]|uniref:RCD1 WWE domain-containing protein n=1 Tax=Morus notabilis TaxID=981085 RepID=W9RDS0_9ROSA|nr:hypothetical protein L484_017737 [Morus notabilis]
MVSIICLDFLHMLRLDLETGLQQPLAWSWINEAEKCFFPERYADDDEARMNGQCEYGRNGDALSIEPSRDQAADRD